MRAHAFEAGLAAALITLTTSGAFAGPVTSLVEHESLTVHGIPAIEIPGQVAHYAPMARDMAMRHPVQRNVLYHQVWLNDT